jgi:hypothetical protein
MFSSSLESSEHFLHTVNIKNDLFKILTEILSVGIMPSSFPDNLSVIDFGAVRTPNKFVSYPSY